MFIFQLKLSSLGLSNHFNRLTSDLTTWIGSSIFNHHLFRLSFKCWLLLNHPNHSASDRFLFSSLCGHFLSFSNICWSFLFFQAFFAFDCLVNPFGIFLIFAVYLFQSLFTISLLSFGGFSYQLIITLGVLIHFFGHLDYLTARPSSLLKIRNQSHPTWTITSTGSIFYLTLVYYTFFYFVVLVLLILCRLW